MNHASLYLKLVVQDARGKSKRTFYSVTPIPTDGRTKAWKLTQKGGKAYEVAVDARGFASCTCADAIYRDHENCKHLRALRALTLLPTQREKP